MDLGRSFVPFTDGEQKRTPSSVLISNPSSSFSVTVFSLILSFEVQDIQVYVGPRVGAFTYTRMGV